jgi:predicted DsbA family dithiol-disulfide isomerase
MAPHQGEPRIFNSQDRKQMSTMKPVEITVTTDFICPWCWIGHRNLKAAIRQAELPLPPRIRYRPFELNPDMPKEGKSRKEYRTAKFGTWARSQMMDADVTAAGKRSGIEFNYDRVLVTPNTRLAHQLMAFAQAGGDAEKIDALYDELFSAYFREGRDIGSSEVLESIAQHLGLDAAELGSWLNTSAAEAAVSDEQVAAHSDGVHAVPTFQIGDSTIQGAQPSYVLVRHLKAAVEEIADE